MSKAWQRNPFRRTSEAVECFPSPNAVHFQKSTTICEYYRRPAQPIITLRRMTADYRGAGVRLLGRGNVENSLGQNCALPIISP